MKLLKVIATGFKNCADDFEISLVPTARKTSEDKEYELLEIADGLFTFSTVGIVGKNASGKTTALELLGLSYEIMGTLSLEKKTYSVNGTKLTLFFFHDGEIYKYSFQLEEELLAGKIIFKDQKIWNKKYYKSKVNEIFEADDFNQLPSENILPEDTSILFFVTRKIHANAFYFNSSDVGQGAYGLAFGVQKSFDISSDILMKIIKVFDENISSLDMVDDGNFRLVFNGKEEVLSAQELYYSLSSGTTKGIVLYMLVVLSLRDGFDLIIDEIENHFHKTLVENIITLYKDKSVNKKNATLIIATHYCEILDLFNRQDNIYIMKSNNKVEIYNMYKDFNVRTELLKSKLFYNDIFKTAVNYEALMDLKKELK